MFRKSIFLGLTVLLGAVLVSMMVKARKQERESPRIVEVFKQSKPTATRVISPEDLVVIDQKMNLLEVAGQSESGRRDKTARHRIVIRNDGPIAYSSLRVEFAYFGSGRRILDTKSQLVCIAVPPHSNVTLDDIAMEGVPGATTRSAVKILYAELDSCGMVEEAPQKK